MDCYFLTGSGYAIKRQNFKLVDEQSYQSVREWPFMLDFKEFTFVAAVMHWAPGGHELLL